ncbi:hypothetical protein ENFA_14c00950 [Enterococcus faecalis]|uniref:Uncharacterized protein n=1 Tax=Enterococcus faecalis ATCC 6055 TaxID=1169311 RepID=R3HTM6_ENTFL|nr:hypothetical protein WOU_02995 [Enterococcus faecalis ATCC 6055]NVJ44311.1 hypothetical protein [Enterococcus faecalis]
MFLIWESREFEKEFVNTNSSFLYRLLRTVSNL